MAKLHQRDRTADRRFFRGLLLLGLMLICALPVAADPPPEEIGPASRPTINLLVPLTQIVTTADGRLLPGLRVWMEHVAHKAGVRMIIQGSSYDRRAADMARHANSCTLGMARRPEREAFAQWLSVIRYDKVAVIARKEDGFTGDLPALLKIADNDIVAPSGIYREILKGHGIRYAAVDDQRSVARMVDSGRIRFGMLLSGVLDMPEVQSMGLKIVGEMAPMPFWFACSRQLPADLATALTAALNSSEAQALRLPFLGSTEIAVDPTNPVPTQ